MRRLVRIRFMALLTLFCGFVGFCWIASLLENHSLVIQVRTNSFSIGYYRSDSNDIGSPPTVRNTNKSFARNNTFIGHYGNDTISTIHNKHTLREIKTNSDDIDSRSNGGKTSVYYITTTVHNSTDIETTVNYTKGNFSTDNMTTDNYIIDTKGCRIPDFDPFHPSVARFKAAPRRSLCGGATAITYRDGNWLRVNKSMIASVYEGQISYCDYWPILRVKGLDTWYTVGSYRNSFDQDIRITDELIEVSCYNFAAFVVYRNIHSFVHLKKDVEDRCKDSFSQLSEKVNTENKLSVLMVGLDSVSRLNSVRQLSQTRSFLLNQENLASFEMLGYTKIGDNTFPNMLSLLSGRYAKELPWPFAGSDNHFDQYDLIWKEFSNRGYRTLFTEEYPHWGIFQYQKQGFRSQPTDYYAIGVLSALNNAIPTMANDSYCVGDRLRTEFILDYSLQFARTFKSEPYFGFVYSSRLTHDYPTYAGYADKPHLNFMTELRKDYLLNKTVFIFFSDHGMRFGPIRQTFIGKLEENMPLMIIAFPKWFLEKYPDVRQTFSINSRRLTTPFDIYQTLREILYFGENRKTKYSFGDRGISLFHEIPGNRTCVGAGLSPRYCACKHLRPIRKDSTEVLNAATVIVKNINTILQDFRRICAALELKKIRKSYLVEGYDQTDEETPRTRLILLEIQTHPGKALFEGTVLRDMLTNLFSVIEDGISRINKYAGQSDCVNDPELQKYCYCRQDTSNIFNLNSFLNNVDSLLKK